MLKIVYGDVVMFRTQAVQLFEV